MRVGYDVVGRSWMYTRRSPGPARFGRGIRSRTSGTCWRRSASRRLIRRRYPVEMTVDAASAKPSTRGSPAPAFGPTDRLIVIHVSAGNPFRRWPIDSFAAVAAALVARDPGRRVILTSGPRKPRPRSASSLRRARCLPRPIECA